MPTPIVQALLGAPPDSPFGAAVAAAAAADRLGQAFTAGYRAALRSLVPSVGDRRAALCATEAGEDGRTSAHPKAITTRFIDGRVTGRKPFVTFGTQAELLLVVARTEQDRLCLAAVEANGAGVGLEALPELPFAPDVSHARARFEAAPAVLLPGDGYDDYLKPFRTVEDIHVFAAALAYLVGLGRRAGWSGTQVARLTALVALFGALALEDPRQRTTHLALGGALALGREAIDACDFGGVDTEERTRWERDRPLLSIAERVRLQRMVGAVAALGLRA